MINLSSCIAFHARRSPQRCALTYRGSEVSYGEFDARIRAVAGWLRSRGIGADDVVAVLMKNSAAFLDIAFAVSHIGAVFLPINFRLSAEEVTYIFAHASVRLLIADDELAAATANVSPVVLVDEAAQMDATRLTTGAEHVGATHRVPSDLVRLMYTSGTTDRPKGVMLSYNNIYWKSADQAVMLGLDRDTRLLVTGPLYHVAALDLPGIAVLSHGGMLSIQRDFNAEACFRAIQTERLTGAWLAPFMTMEMLAHPHRDRYDVSSLQWVIGGGAATPAPHIRAFSQLFTHARYIDAYGLTETCGGDTLMEAGFEIDKIGSAGRATAHLDIQIQDDLGRAVPAGMNGEVCLRGPKVSKGYWNDPDKTKAAFSGGWFRSGDIGYLDPDGFLFLTDRKKDIIISGAEMIASSEVERVIHELPGVREVAVVGLPDPHWGEQPIAIVVLAKDATLDLPMLAAHCRSQLASFKVPKKLFIRDRLPRNPAGKILKRVLRDEFETRA